MHKLYTAIRQRKWQICLAKIRDCVCEWITTNYDYYSPFALQILAMVSVAVEERGRRSHHRRNLSVSLCDLLALPLQRERAAFCWRLLQWIRLSVGHLRGQKSSRFTPSASSQTNCGGERDAERGAEGEGERESARARACVYAPDSTIASAQRHLLGPHRAACGGGSTPSILAAAPGARHG